jgi:hypothetical protein
MNEDEERALYMEYEKKYLKKKDEEYRKRKLREECQKIAAKEHNAEKKALVTPAMPAKLEPRSACPKCGYFHGYHAADCLARQKRYQGKSKTLAAVRDKGDGCTCGHTHGHSADCPMRYRMISDKLYDEYTGLFLTEPNVPRQPRIAGVTELKAELARLTGGGVAPLDLERVEAVATELAAAELEAEYGAIERGQVTPASPDSITAGVDRFFRRTFTSLGTIMGTYGIYEGRPVAVGIGAGFMLMRVVFP